MLRRFMILLFCLLPMGLQAQESSRSILVLDASGSMWGQIEGVTKIEIARDVIGGLLQDLPETSELGLTVYGHRRRGDCSDIETLIEPGGDQRAAIAAAVDSINPRGKTPLSAAVIAAAEALKYTEERATVILVSDGKETCDFDPCAVGRELEATGIDFTAHVIGFDVSDPADRAELQCLAEETGGTFATASNAAELTEALSVVADPEPQPISVTLQATEGDGGAVIGAGIVWSLAEINGAALLDSVSDARPEATALPDSLLLATVTRLSDGAMSQREFTLDTGGQTITLVLPELPPEPVLILGQAYIEGSNARIETGLIWSLHAKDGTAIVENLNSNALRADLLPGDYRIEAMRMADEMTRGVDVHVGTEDATVNVIFPELAEPAQLRIYSTERGVNGSQNREIVWSLYDKDGNAVLEHQQGRDLRTEVLPGQYTVIALRTEDEHTEELTFAALKRGTTVEVVFPPYVPAATLSAPDTAAAGSTIIVSWEGPNEQNDYIAVAETGARDNTHVNYQYTREGPALPLVMPPKPGTYEVRYVLNNGRKVIVSRPIEITPVEVSISAADQAAAGSDILVEWVGPDYQNDYIAIAEIGAPNNKHINYTYTRDGSPLQLQMPVDPGTYELRYVMSQARTVLATRQIEAVDTAFEVTAPESAIAGETILVEWVGGDYQNDYIAVAEVGMADNKHSGYTYTRDGTPLQLTLPLDPGEYEIRYVVSQDRTVKARVPIRIDPVSAELAAEPSVIAGSQVLVTWTGPDYRNDFIAIAEISEPDNKYDTYSYTRDGAPLQVQAPSAPGSYELRYVANGSPRQVLARIPLTVADVTARVSAEASVSAGGNLSVTWEGPDYRNDYIAISKIGDNGYETYTYTRDGSPLIIKAPEQSGDYELRYVINQDRRVITATPLKVE